MSSQSVAKGKVDVVTGGAGFIGSHLVDHLLAVGRHVRVIDNFISGRLRNLVQHRDDARLDVREIDIRDGAAVAEAMAGAARVFRLAALADIVPSIQRPRDYVAVNVDGTFNVLEAAREARVRRFVYAASGRPMAFRKPIRRPKPPPSSRNIRTR